MVGTVGEACSEVKAPRRQRKRRNRLRAGVMALGLVWNWDDEWILGWAGSREAAEDVEGRSVTALRGRPETAGPARRDGLRGRRGAAVRRRIACIGRQCGELWWSGRASGRGPQRAGQHCIAAKAYRSAAFQFQRPAGRRSTPATSSYPLAKLRELCSRGVALDDRLVRFGEDTIYQDCRVSV